MKIISDFQDFYDGVDIRQGDDVVYSRFSTSWPREQFEHEFALKPRFLTPKHYGGVQTPPQVAVYFCGERYVGYRPDSTGYYFTFESLRDRVAALGRRGSTYHKALATDLSYEFIAKEYQELMKPMAVGLEVFQQVGAPVFLAQGRDHMQEVVVNPCLESVNFARHMLPVIAYQELRAFIPRLVRPGSVNSAGLRTGSK